MAARDAVHTDVNAVALLLAAHCRGKAELAVCRSRAGTAIKLARRPKATAYALVVDRDDEISGFLFARPDHAFNLLTNIKIMQVHFLVGRHAARPLLRELRRRTNMRIVINTWNALAEPNAMQRLLRDEGFRPFGAIYES